MRFCNQKLKVSGVYCPGIRVVSREIVHYGCALKNVGATIKLVAGFFGVELEDGDLMDARSVLRFILEGMFASQIQLGHDISNAKSMFYSDRQLTQF